jgi:uncharacterized protein YycO
MSTLIEGGRTIGAGALELADIIVSTGNAKISSAIRTATSSIVSHSMLYAGNGHVIEAVGEGVRKVLLQDAISQATLAIALRRTGLTPGIANVVVGFADQQRGRSYDTRGIAAQAGYQLDRWFLCRVTQVRDCETQAARANLWLQSNDAFFCSELIATAFSQAGLPLTDTRPSAVSPQTLVEVVSTGKLQYVGHLLGS